MLLRTIEQVAARTAAGPIGEEMSGLPNNIKRLAIHEAAHVVAGLALGQVALVVEIHRDGGGMVTWGFGEPGEDPRTPTDGETLQKLQDISTHPAMGFGPDDVLDMNLVRKDVRALLQRYWPAVEALAECLCSRIIGSSGAIIYGSEIKRIWESHRMEKGEVKNVFQERRIAKAD